MEIEEIKNENEIMVRFDDGSERSADGLLGCDGGAFECWEVAC